MAEKLGLLEVGDVFAIPIGNSLYGFGVIAEGKDCAVFDYAAVRPFPALQELIKMSVAFRVPVFQDIAKNGKWERIGRVILPSELAERSFYWTQAVGDNQIYKFKEIANKIAISEAEISGLERMVWYDDPFLKARLQDHIAGRPNAMAQRQKKIKYYDPETRQEIR